MYKWVCMEGASSSAARRPNLAPAKVYGMRVHLAVCIYVWICMEGSAVSHAARILHLQKCILKIRLYLNCRECTCVCMYACTHVCMYVRTSIDIIRPCTRHHVIKTLLYTCMRVFMYVCMCAYDIYIYIYIYIYTHQRRHHTPTHAPSCHQSASAV